MGRLDEHEAFLRAIFDAPDDDTPRLIYADFLEENGDRERAEFIRVQCEHRRLLALDPGDPGLRRLHELLPREVELQRRIATNHPDALTAFAYHDRGFREASQVLHIEPLEWFPYEASEPDQIRARIVAHYPHWFGATRLRVASGRPLKGEQMTLLLSLAALQHVTDWDLSGHVEEITGGPQTEDAGTYALIDMRYQPVITVEGVETLAHHRGARRIRSLILNDNQLENDAFRALARSPYLINLERLELGHGNYPIGKTWQELRVKFGEDVVE